MKLKPIVLFVGLTIVLAACNDSHKLDEPIKNIEITSLSYTKGSTGMLPNAESIPVLRLKSHENGNVLVQLTNTELACGSGSVSVEGTIEDNIINVEIIDTSTSSTCFSPRQLQFEMAVPYGETYSLQLIESQQSYSRDTFALYFTNTENLDTTISGFLPTDITNKVKVCFRFERTGGWTSIHSGWLMDYNGNIYNYIHWGNWQSEDSLGFINSKDMTQNLMSTDSLHYTIAKEKLDTIIPLIKEASLGEISEPAPSSADAGLYKYYAYLYDCNSNTYKEVLLKQIGDIRIKNDAPIALELYKWMRNVNDTIGVSNFYDYDLWSR